MVFVSKVSCHVWVSLAFLCAMESLFSLITPQIKQEGVPGTTMYLNASEIYTCLTLNRQTLTAALKEHLVFRKEPGSFLRHSEEMYQVIKCCKLLPVTQRAIRTHQGFKFLHADTSPPLPAPCWERWRGVIHGPAMALSRMTCAKGLPARR